MSRLYTMVLAAVLLITTGACGADGLSFGLLGGLNSSQFEFNYTEMPGLFDPDARLGLRLGGFVEYPVSGPFAVQLGLDYNERGYEFESGVADETGANQQQLTFRPYIQYLSLPLAVKARPEMGRVDPFVMAGPRFDINVGHSDDLGWGDLYGGFRDTQWGMTIGGGAEVAVSPRLVVIFGVQYNLDFDDAYKTDLLTIKRESLDFVTGLRF